MVNKTSEEENTESTSTEMGKTVNEAKNEISENTTESTKENKITKKNKIQQKQYYSPNSKYN